MRKIQRRKSDFMVKCQRGSAVYQQFKGIGVQDVRWTSALHGSEWNGDLPQQAKMRRAYTGALLANLQKMKGRTLFMRNLEKKQRLGRNGIETSCYGYDMENCLKDSVISKLNIPIIYDADISHKGPSMTIINGAIANINVSKGKANIIFELK